MDGLAQWFEKNGWQPFEYQREVWQHAADGRSGLVHAPTGNGKTYAILGGFLTRRERQLREGSIAKGVQLLWITPMRALAGDTCAALERPLQALVPGLRVELRHGDTTAAIKRRQRTRPPEVLVTTPESLSLLLSYPDADQLFGSLLMVAVDEWHELLGTKRGVQTELGLAAVRRFAPHAITWGLSATLGNLREAMAVLLGSAARKTDAVLVEPNMAKAVSIQTLIPETMEKFPWAGHLGTRMVEPVIRQIEQARSTLLFTNTRSQAELWHAALLKAAPPWVAQLAIHHGSLDKAMRQQVEHRLDAGALRCVVCTSSLDLGVDFSPVEQVIQVGSPKGIARLMQRAGRSGHQPGAESRFYGVPTNAFELLEFSAARAALQRGEIESRVPIRRALDVLVQHCVTVAASDQLTPQKFLSEVRTTYSYADLTDPEWEWVFQFASRGGAALAAYPQYKKVELEPVTNRMCISNTRVARFHRVSIGTITSDAEVVVQLGRGRSLGTIEESFISRIRPGDTFTFSGRRLELVRFRDMRATVRLATKKTGAVPTWQGGRSPLSTELASAVCRTIHAGAQDAEMAAAATILEIQKSRSALPDYESLLIERTAVRRDTYYFCYPFAGRLVHEGLAALVAYRLGKGIRGGLKTTVNDYGFSLQGPANWEVEKAAWREALSLDGLTDDLTACMNAGELARRQFREISRVAGLILQGYPGREKSVRQLQVSSTLLFDVFERYDPDNLLLTQARREVLERQLEFSRLRAALERIEQGTFLHRSPERLTPFAFPLWAEQLATRVQVGGREARVQAMADLLEREWASVNG